MAIKILALVAVGLCVVALVACCRRARRPVVPRPDQVPALDEPDETDDADLRAALAPGTPGFVLRSRGRAALAAKTIVLAGRLQVYVRAGSQYSTWRQFPGAVRYEVRSPAGRVALTPDFTLSISDEPESYDAYAAEPADRVVGQSFAENVYATLTAAHFGGKPLVTAPGKYGVRAHYQGAVSNWVELDVAP